MSRAAPYSFTGIKWRESSPRGYTTL